MAAHAFAMVLLTGSAVVAAGILLGWSADQIASATGLGEVWTGWVLLAGATSIPEFVTDTSAVKIHAANLACGDLFGSSLTNMGILALLVLWFGAGESDRDGAVRNGSIDLLNAALAIFLTILATIFTRVHSDFGIRGLRPEPLSILVIWLAGTRCLYRRRQSLTKSANSGDLGSLRLTSLKRICLPVLLFIVGTGIILAVAPLFAQWASQFAALNGWKESFVGIWLLGCTTALPDLVSSVTACRFDAFELAFSSLYGSCAFNMVVFYTMDLVSPAPVFSLLDPVLALPGALAVLLMILGVALVTVRRQLSIAPGLRGAVLLASYCLAIWIIYLYR
jgi:cation:H+ antiporter